MTWPQQNTGTVVRPARRLFAPDYSVPRAHALAHSPAATPDTAAYYTNIIMWLRDTHPAYTKWISEHFPVSAEDEP